MIATSLLAGLAFASLPLSTAPSPQVPAALDASPVAGTRVQLLRHPTTIAKALGHRALPPTSSSAATLSTLVLDVGIEGDMPRDLAVTPDGTTLLVACRDTDTVEFLDAASGTWLASVDVGERPLGVAIAPDGTRAVVPCARSNSVTVLDVQARTALGTIALTGLEPYRAVVTSDSQRAVVGLVGAGGNAGRIGVVDLATLTEVATFTTVGQAPRGSFINSAKGIRGVFLADFALTPDDTRVVIPDFHGAQIGIYDVTTGQTVSVLATSSLPNSVDISADGSTAVIAYANVLGGGVENVGTLDLATSSLTVWDTGSTTWLPDVRITPDRRYAILNTFGGIEFADLATGAATTVGSQELIASVHLSFDGRYAIVAGGVLRVLDVQAQTQLAALAGGGGLDGVMSPVAHRYHAAGGLNDETVSTLDTAGIAARLWTQDVGRPVEMDAPSGVAVSSDSALAVVTGVLSGNVAIVDLATPAVLGHVDTGEDPRLVELTPGGDTAVVLNGGSLSVVDVAARQRLADLPLLTFARDLHLSSDGRTATTYSQDVGQNRISIIDVAGAASSIVSEISLPGTSWNSMEVTPDGGTVTVLSAIDDLALVIDTQQQAVVASVPVGTLPLVSTLASDGSTLYVGNQVTDSLSVIALAGPASALTATVLGVRTVRSMLLDAQDRYLYLVSLDTGGGAATFDLLVVDTQSNQVVADVALPDPPPLILQSPLMSALGDQLLIYLSDGDLVRTSMAGPQSAVVESITPTGFVNGLAVAPGLGLALLTLPGETDALDLVRFGGDSTPYCTPANPNSTGQGARIRAFGTFLAGAHPLHLEADRLPPNQFGYFLVGQTQGFVQPPMSQGNLCLSGQIGRFSQAVASSGPAGTLALDVDQTALPFSPPIAVAAGDTWNFQCWFRDSNPGPTSNFTSAVSVAFE